MIVGVLGAGQLARMLALAGFPLGLQFIFLEPSEDACASKLGEQLSGGYSEPKLLAQLAERADIVTYEFENVPSEVAKYLAEHTQVYPSPKALAVAQDRLVEKNFFQSIAIPTPAYSAVNSLEELHQAISVIGYPAVIKTRTQGYDGKGQYVLKSFADLLPAWEAIQAVPAVVEAFVAFTREVSIIAARSTNGEIVFYPLSENSHQDGILRISRSCTDDAMQLAAEDYVRRLLEALDYVGILALELFEQNGRLLANEFAPRVHNSGHWTIEGCETSQFANHLRAICKLPLGSTNMIGHAAMVNFIGGLPLTEEVLALEQTHLHLYDKQPRKGRKVAHATVRTETLAKREELLAQLVLIAKRVNDS
jgi:5-(carboxyamino)imidazole ribonucleotide synthase